MTSPQPYAPVVIVGAGPSGVTAAVLLAQEGVDVIVLDRRADVFAQPRAVHLDDEVYRILARIGVAERFSAISRPSVGLRLLDARHAVLAEFRRDGDISRHGHPQANMFDQPELEALLRARMLEHPRISFRGGVEVNAVSQGVDGVRIDLTERESGRSETLRASYVLGCDGANSVVRRSIGATMQDLRFEQRWLVVDVNTDVELHQWEGVHQVCDTERAGTYMRISDRRHRWEFQLGDGETSDDFATVAALLPLIEPWVGAVPDGDLELVRVAEYTFRAQLADRWRDGRVFLLGDSAHLTPPFIGQGMGAGLRDAANLAWKLAGVIDGTLPERVLETYEQERRPHAAQMIRLAIIVGTAMTRGGRPGDLMRRVVVPRLRLVPGLREKVLDSATPRLRTTVMVRRQRWRRGLAGTLCPNLSVDEEARFDDVADGRFMLLTRHPLDSATTADATRRRVGILEVGRDEPLGAWLTKGGADAALVRPDGTVMASGRTANAVLAGLARL
ncbi:bifunctional 3-(3-hydroxy-phenyl)propionate/3-hydroxycinnamic acid hydroxylase [Aeromicrobium ginsengisoli]|uniref:Bifunctional 3-(3-hydroxy-phenyl)propionate/3-hydroxycinnamic acid hydroxylase n=1 Tax=Aeromicrobium ginsengisoli TaxID=363867 RepID=A0A5M4FED1_9ACTN|nr:bifunctional 3-(3-hydroxy-phenyl)propionate/3-hydroxycinnamic acid hydroxylase [Aeromicrobium ginsengisoli]KAA1397622.1 bifunctional 3-(3-hydroxy-phenyl)propionate/3-hydroxycinnamic acid hydroxylase [Aeromicrobium ginsengisoli]